MEKNQQNQKEINDVNSKLIFLYAQHPEIMTDLKQKKSKKSQKNECSIRRIFFKSCCPWWMKEDVIGEDVEVSL